MSLAKEAAMSVEEAREVLAKPAVRTVLKDSLKGDFVNHLFNRSEAKEVIKRHLEANPPKSLASNVWQSAFDVLLKDKKR